MMGAAYTADRYFYPRPPRGGRRSKSRTMLTGWIFLSTPSARRATRQLAGNNQAGLISIHALRDEGDPPCDDHRSGAGDFYPRPPRGGRRTTV